MAIRMTDDPRDPNRKDYNEDNGNRGGRGNEGGMIGLLLPLLMSLFKTKGGLAIIVIAAGAYFILGKGNCNIADVVKQFSQSGYSYNPNEYNKANVYEGLDDNNAKNPLPEAVSLLKYAPRAGDQGQQGSCVAWSSAYAAQTILTAAATRQDPDRIVFSPSYLYNQIRLDDCQGSYIQYAMDAMKKNGGVALQNYPYNEQDCSRAPQSGDIRQGQENRIYGFTRLTQGDNLNSINVRAVKEHLSKDAPVIIGMMVGQSFMNDMMGRELWTPQGMDASQVGMGGHAMCVIGYDDDKFGGAFQILNSWGAKWGKDGVGWVRYGDFKTYVKEAYGIDPLPKSANVAAIPLECNIGLVNNEGSSYIPLKAVGNNTYQTVKPIKIGTRFKMEVKNATECYVYIFSSEADGSSFVLFPYMKQGEVTSKHSPYFGITGYRLFPKFESMEADNIGNRDYIAIVASKKELDYNRINTAINQSSQADFGAKVKDALSGIATTQVQSGVTNGNIYFKATANEQQPVIASIVIFDKQ